MSKMNTKMKDNQQEQELEKEVSNENSETETLVAPQESAEQEEILQKLSPEEQIKDLEDRNLRLLAEMQNLRVRQQKDLKDTREYAVAGFANDMISLSENIYRARDAIPSAQDELYSKILQGIDLTIDELKKVFDKHGIKRIAPNVGDKFDYAIHQAIAQVPTNDVADGCVVSLIAAGYTLKERVLRAAMVAVAKNVAEVKEGVAHQEPLQN
jgi:molecular chaperone GrpE